MKIKRMNEFNDYDPFEDDDFDFDEVKFPDIPTPEGKMYILQHIDNGMFLFNSDLARNKLFTSDVRRAKSFINLNSALKSTNNIRLHRGKWILIEVEGLKLGNKKLIE